MPTPIRALVVEDDPTTSLFIREVLARRGHEVEVFESGEAAWEAAQRRTFSLAILDMSLPGMDGAQLCRKLRQLPHGEEMVVMFVTGAEAVEDLGRALDAGADDYVLKPVLDANLPARFALAERRLHFLHERLLSVEGTDEQPLKDSVTDLVNRTIFFEKLHRTARRATRENRKPDRKGRYLFAVLVLNMDGFKEIIDRFGFRESDALLREVGERLEECIRSGDTVARFGGDEFVILLDDIKDVSDPARVMLRIEEAFTRPFVLDGEDVVLSACAGVSLKLAAAADPVQLLEEARSALTRAKAEGPGTYQIHDLAIHAQAMAQLRLEARLRKAVENGELVLYTQPIVSLDDGKIAGFEALVRWNDPERGIVGPGEFIQMAEDTGEIIRLGAWVIQEAVRQLAAWNAQRSPDQPPLFMSINVSGRQFTNPGLAEEVTAAMRRFGVPPKHVHIEITETALMTDLQAATGILRRLKDADVQIHVDDFGTGYSSLSYLVSLPLDGLKIDQSFVNHMTESMESREVVRIIRQLASALNLSVVAEGVETDHQLEELRNLHCEYGQGYLLGRPGPADEMARLLRYDSSVPRA